MFIHYINITLFSIVDCNNYIKFVSSQCSFLEYFKTPTRLLIVVLLHKRSIIELIIDIATQWLILEGSVAEGWRTGRRDRWLARDRPTNSINSKQFVTLRFLLKNLYAIEESFPRRFLSDVGNHKIIVKSLQYMQFPNFCPDDRSYISFALGIIEQQAHVFGRIYFVIS